MQKETLPYVYTYMYSDISLCAGKFVNKGKHTTHSPQQESATWTLFVCPSRGKCYNPAPVTHSRQSNANDNVGRQRDYYCLVYYWQHLSLGNHLGMYYTSEGYIIVVWTETFSQLCPSILHSENVKGLCGHFTGGRSISGHDMLFWFLWTCNFRHSLVILRGIHH